MAEIESSSAGKPDRIKIVADAMQRAEELYKAGNVVEARKMWNSIISLYGNNKELIPQVRKARARLKDKEDPEGEE
jgi:hypothetical protein